MDVARCKRKNCGIVCEECEERVAENCNEDSSR